LTTFAVLDGASVPDLLDKLYSERPVFECLYRGEIAPDLMEVAPYLVKLEANSEFSNWLINRGWGRHWGIFARSSADIRILHQHFRRFLTVYREDTGAPLLFRYYDPRVIGPYLQSCEKEELALFFGLVDQFLLEGEEPKSVTTFSLASGNLAVKSSSWGE
jgi:hypothetical protein